jgi:hypothetical protein
MRNSQALITPPGMLAIAARISLARPPPAFRMKGGPATPASAVVIASGENLSA